jgi:hypothetical protein
MSTIPQDGFRPTVGKEDPLTDNALKPTAPAIPEATPWLALGAAPGSIRPPSSLGTEWLG